MIKKLKGYYIVELNVSTRGIVTLSANLLYKASVDKIINKIINKKRGYLSYEKIKHTTNIEHESEVKLIFKYNECNHIYTIRSADYEDYT